MVNSANDEFFDIKEQFRSLTAEQAIEFATQFIDRNCSNHLDAEYLKRAITATGSESEELARTYAAAGSAAAQVVYGTAKLHGKFMEQNVSEGLFWLRRAHNNGNTKASIVLAAAYLEGAVVGQSVQKAVEYIAIAARKDDPAGQYLYAKLLLEGEGVEQDEEAAILWLQRSAQAGYEKSKLFLIENGLPVNPAIDA